MPLLGKLVVIKRNGTDGTEFPLTASCLFGRKLDCDIRIQLPQVSKEHCRIEFNENKELILTNLSSVNPTLINGEVLLQSERLKHGDLITIIDRSFRFEYPPAPTPKKKRLSTPGKGETVKVLKDQQVKSTPGTTEKKKFEHSTDTCLKDGSNLPSSLDQCVGDQENKASMDSTLSPFSDLYNMVKRDLATKPVWKSTSLSNTPLSRSAAEKQEVEKASSENEKLVTPKSTQKKRRSSTAKTTDDSLTENLFAHVNAAKPVVHEEEKKRTEGVRSPGSQKKIPQATSQKFTPDQVAQQIVFESPRTKSPKTRKSSAFGTPENQTTTQNLSEPSDAEESKAIQVTRTSPRASAGKRFQAQDVLQATPTSYNKAGGQTSSKKHKCDDLPLPAPKRKRVSFGLQLSPELFDKRLPPNSPLRRGATPGRRSLGFSQKSHSLLLRRASTIGLMGYQLDEDIAESPVKNDLTKLVPSPAQTPSPGKTQKTAKTPSPGKTQKTAKTPSPGKMPKIAKTPSPGKTPKTAKTPSPGKTPKTAKTPSPGKTPKTAKTPSPGKTPKTARTPSPAKMPKTPSPGKTPKTAKTPSPGKTANTAKTPSPGKTANTAKTPSPGKTPKTARTPSPAKMPKADKTLSSASPSFVKRSPSPKSITPKFSSSTPPSSSNLSTPKSSKWLSLLEKSPSKGEESLLKTPTTHGRFSVSRISTPSPVYGQEKEVKEKSVLVERPRECATPRAMPRRSSMKASARKTPKSVMKSALEVVRSRRSGASLANLKVVSSWADIVKFGQAKPQTEGGAKKTASKRAAVKQTKVTKPKTPAHRLKDLTSTGHADSPASIVVGKAYLRSTQHVGAAPKVVCNVALFKKDMKMDEDLTGVSDIFKTPANKRKSAFTKTNQCPASPHGVAEMSVINTPEESGEMVVSPMSVASTAKLGRYNSDAVTRLLQDNQDGSLIEEMEVSAADSRSADVLSEDQIEVVRARTPRQKRAQSECLTGVKRLMRTPKQKPEPIEDLRGKLLKTPKEPKLPQEDSLDGVKELLNTPKQMETSLEVKNSPVVCAVRLQRLDETQKDEQEGDLTGVKRLMKTSKQKKQVVEEDLTGVQQMMKTPKLRKQPAEEDLTRVQQLMKTPKQKKQPVEEDLTGLKQMMKTPKQKNQSVEDLVGVKRLLQTPKEKGEPVESDFGIDYLMKTPKQKSNELPGSTIICDVFSAEDASEEKENICPAEGVEKESQATVCLQIEAKGAETSYEDQVTSCEVMVGCTSETVSISLEATPSAEFQQSHRSSSARKTRCGAQVRKTQKGQELQVDSDSATVSGTEKQSSADSSSSVPTARARRGKSVVEVLKDAPAQSPARKSSRGRITTVQAKVQKSSLSTSEDEQVALKPTRGRKAGQDVQVVIDLKASGETGLAVNYPAPRAKRGRKDKHESEKSQEPENLPEASIEELSLASESTEIQQSAEIEASKSNTRAKRGRTTRRQAKPVAEVEISEIKIQDAVVEKEAVALESSAAKTQKSTTKSRRGRAATKQMQAEESSEPTPVVMESNGTSSNFVALDKAPASDEVQSGELEDLVKTNSKPRRGRTTKKEGLVKEKSIPAPDSEVLSEEPVPKSRQRRKVALSSQAVLEESNVEPRAAETEVKAEAPVVRSSRGARTKQVRDAGTGPAKETPETLAVIVDPVEEPMVKTARGSRRTKQPKAQESQEEEKSKTSADSETTVQSEATAARSARGKRTAAVKPEAEAPVKRGRHVATVEAPPPVVKPSRGRKAAAKIETEEDAAAAVVELVSEEPKIPASTSDETDSGPKRGRGRTTKKAVVPTKDASASEELQKSQTNEEPAAKYDREAKQPVVKGRKGRGAKKPEEPEPEKPATEESVHPSRRGRGVTTVVSLNDGGPKRGQKRKDMENASEETQESFPKRKRGRGAVAQTNEAAPAKGRRTAVKEAEESPEVEAEVPNPKKEEKPVRGRRKATQVEERVSETTTRRGTRGQKKAETNVPSAPVRQTRRK